MPKLKQFNGKEWIEIAQPGKDGENYILKESDKTEIASKIKIPVIDRVIEKTETIIEQPIITNEIKEVAVTDSAEQIKKKLESLKGDKRLDASAIKNLPKTEYSLLGAGGDRVAAGTNITITRNGNGEKVISSTGGGGEETDPVWTSEKTNYYTKSEVDALTPTITNELIDFAETSYPATGTDGYVGLAQDGAAIKLFAFFGGSRYSVALTADDPAPPEPGTTGSPIGLLLTLTYA